MSTETDWTNAPATLSLFALFVVLSAAGSPLVLAVAGADRATASPTTTGPASSTATMASASLTPSSTTTQSGDNSSTATPGGGNSSGEAADSGITRVEYGGPGVATRARGRTYVWTDGETLLNVSVQPVGDPGPHELCLTLRADNRTVSDHGCQTVDVQSYGGAARFGIENLQANGTGNRTFLLTYRQSSEDGRVDTEMVPIVAIEHGGDVDDDSLSNEAEVKRGTDLTRADTDSDGLLDGHEVKDYNSSATDPDTDGDGARDGQEVEVGSEPDNPDTDGDGLTDGEELNQYDTDPTKVDTDDDGLTDWEEVKQYGTDPTEVDSDGDGLSDKQEIKQFGTDPNVADTDGDGIEDGEEVERGTNPHETTTPTETPGSGLVDRNATMFIGLGILLAVGGIVVYGRLGGSGADGGDFDGPDAPSPGSATGETAPADHAASGTADTPPPDGSSAAGTGNAGGAAVAGGAAGLDPDLLSPEQYITRLLEVNGGYMKQSEIVDEVDWSKATVSRRLSSMEEDGEIERTRMGRGKIVTLPDVDLDETN